MASHNHLGLEINDHFIKYAELSQIGRDFILGKYGLNKLSDGVLEDGSIRLHGKLLKSILEIQKLGQWKDVTVSHMPDQVYLADILKEAGFKDIYFESSGEAVARVAINRSISSVNMIVYFTGDKINIYGGGRNEMLLLATYNFHNSLLAQTRDTEIVYSFIKEKIDEQYVSWHTHQDEKGKKRPKIQKVILAGEFDKPEELKEYLGKYLKLNVELAQVWQNIFSLEHHTPEVRFNDSLGYAVALGLALRPFDK